MQTVKVARVGFEVREFTVADGEMGIRSAIEAYIATDIKPYLNGGEANFKVEVIDGRGSVKFKVTMKPHYFIDIQLTS